MLARGKIVVVLLLLISFSPLRAEKNTAPARLPQQAKYLIENLYEMSEPELVLLIDSLFDTKDSTTAILFAIVQDRINELHSFKPKNKFVEGFSIYPGHRFYGLWDMQHIFPYTDSLYKADTVVKIDLSPAVNGSFRYPCNGLLTSSYGWRDSAFHRGVDIDLNGGDSVRSMFSGMVRFAGRQGGFGNVVVVRHWNGLETLYAHLSTIKVKPGDLVMSGQLLGKGGATGHATGTHLHLEVRFRGVAIDPSWLIKHQAQQLQAEQVELVRTKYGYAVRPLGCKFHTVGKGDTMSKIAQRYGVSVNQLKVWNNWGNRVALRVGQQVRICAPPTIKCS